MAAVASTAGMSSRSPSSRGSAGTVTLRSTVIERRWIKPGAIEFMSRTPLPFDATALGPRVRRCKPGGHPGGAPKGIELGLERP